MTIRFVTKTVHAWLDYPVALSLMLTPVLLGLGSSSPVAFWLSIAIGVAAFVLTLFTDHQTGVFRVLPFALHITVDRLVGVLFIAAPFVFSFRGLDAWYYWVNGAAVLLVTVVLAAPENRPNGLTTAQA